MAYQTAAAQRRQAIEALIAEHNARITALHDELLKAQALEAREKSKQPQIKKIDALLEVARNALEEAGMIGVEHGIDFTFQGPREEIDFNIKWMSSDCYGSARWYEHGYQPG